MGRRLRLPALLLALWAGMAGAGERAPILAAAYGSPTDRYPHGILGDALEWGSLRLTLGPPEAPREITLTLPQHRVFEDVAPRLVDLDGTGRPLVMVVESDADRGARLALYDAGGAVAATPFIGTRNRWLAPLGAADLDGDGQIELAYVDRPHLARILRIWRWQGGRLVPLASHPGVTNHRIGERDIAGGIRDCGAGPEMILADAAWRQLLALRFDGTGVTRRVIGPHEGRASFAAAMAC